MSRGVAVVTGGGSGFGRGIAARCAALGFDVALLDIDSERAVAEATALGAEYPVQTIGVLADVGDNASVRAAADTVSRQLGGVDLVFSNVGVQQIGALESFSDEAWTWVLNVNVIGAARVARAFLPLLRRSSQAHLAFTASSSVLAPTSHLAAYQASKFAVVGLAETLRLELRDAGIAVSMVFPSGMMTRHLESSLAARPATVTGPIADREDLDAMLASNPSLLQDVAMAEDVAGHAVDDVLAGERYIITHGDLATAVEQQQQLVRRALDRTRNRA